MATPRRRSTTRWRPMPERRRGSCPTSGSDFRRGERMAEAVHGRVQLTLDGALGEAQSLGNLAELQPLVLAHHEDDTLPRRKLRDLRLEDLPQLAPIGARLGIGALFRSVQ